jgi:hypothetical protein
LLFENVKIKIHITIIFPVVLYGCETWSLTLKEECRLRMFENRVLRRIFWPKMDEVTGEWKRLHKKDLMLCIPHQISSGDQEKKTDMAGHVTGMEGSRGAYRVLVGKPE